jgi:hypothetical protein
MNFCVLVKISKRMASFWYQLESHPYVPLIIKGSNEVPLYFYVNTNDNDFKFGKAAQDRFFSKDPNALGNYFEIITDPSQYFNIYGNKKPVKQLFYYGIEEYLSHFINSVLYKNDSIESYRLNFPLRLFFETDIEDKEKSLIESLFTEAGYDNVERIDYNEALFEVLCSKGIIGLNKSVLMLKGIDDTLYLELYKNILGLPTAFSKLAKQGADPRVKILASMIIGYINEQYSYLSLDIEAEINALLPYSANLLKNITPIIKGEAELIDGTKEWFSVKERSLNDRLLYDLNDRIIDTTIEGLLKSNNLKSEETIILLGSDEINTSYFLNKLLSKFPNVKGIGESDSNEAMQLVFSKISNSHYLAKKKVPVAPPIPPVLPKNSNSGQFIETKIPELPTFIKSESKDSKVKLPPPLPPPPLPFIKTKIPELPIFIKSETKDSKVKLPPLPPKKQ